MSMKPNSPITMEGMPASTSTAAPSTRFCRGEANSARYTPQPTPGNSASSMVSTTSPNVPTHAGQRPSHTGARPSTASSGGVLPNRSSGPNTGSARQKRYPMSTNTTAGTATDEISASARKQRKETECLMTSPPDAGCRD